MLAIALLLFLLFLLISLGLSTAGSQALFAGKLTADIPEDGKIPQTSLEELLRLDSNLDGVPDYQQPDLFTPDNEYDRRVVNALKWVNEHINELELPESAQPKPSQTKPAGRAALVLWGKQFGLNLTSLTPEEVNIMERAVQKSGTYKQGKSMMAAKSGNDELLYGL